MKLAAAVVASALLTATAQAHDGTVMTERMEHYFAGEKAEGWVFLGVGAATLGAGSYLATRTSDRVAFHSAWPVLGFGLIEAVAGIVLLVRTDDQVAGYRSEISQDPEGYRARELDRMHAVQSQFSALFWIELVLAVAGASMAVAGEIEEIAPLAGVGYGLAAQSTAMLVLDIFAAGRADTYVADLDGFQPAPAKVQVGLTFAF